LILFYDTETTGFPVKKAPSADPRQPHLVQLALVTYDDAGQETDAQCVIIKPDGWEIPAEVIALHGISLERALAEGIPEAEAVALFVTTTDSARLRVAHNEAFDSKIMRIALLRAGTTREEIEAMEARPKFCTCEAAKPIVNLPPTRRMLDYGFNGPKPPKLAECMKHFFGEEFPGAHDALVDTRACARIYWRLQEKEA
jgi:DNA polymerase-3 subunit epsilon